MLRLESKDPGGAPGTQELPAYFQVECSLLMKSGARLTIALLSAFCP